MKKIRLTVALIFHVGVQQSWAGLFDRKPATPPTPQQVMTTLHNLKNNPDAGKRTSAAEDLQQLDLQTYPEVLPALVDTLHNDTNVGVRRAAASVLGRIRPFSSEAAQALEQSKEKDSSMLVRFQARTALLGYRVPNQPLVQVPNKQAQSRTPAQVGAPSQFAQPQFAGQQFTGQQFTQSQFTGQQATQPQFHTVSAPQGGSTLFIEVPKSGTMRVPHPVSSEQPILVSPVSSGAIMVPGPDQHGKIHPVAVPQFSQQQQIVIPAGMTMPGVADGPVQLAPMPRLAP
jgi:hypothetical protein